ncbi:MAG: DUF6171 family protein [Lachnospiraceae bacterium]
MEQKICRRCLIREMGEEEYHKMIGQYIEFLDRADRAPDELTEKRLEICRECDRLNAGTCLSCGCYVEIRTAIKRAKCPNRKW